MVHAGMTMRMMMMLMLIMMMSMLWRILQWILPIGRCGSAPRRPPREGTSAHGRSRLPPAEETPAPVPYTHLRAPETVLDLVWRLLLEKKTNKNTSKNDILAVHDSHHTALDGSGLSKLFARSQRYAYG